MEKIIINGEEYVKVNTVREAIADLRKTIGIRYNHKSMDERLAVHDAYTDIGKALVQEKLDAATTPEEIDAILEIQGDYIVCRKSESEFAKLEFFNGWDFFGGKRKPKTTDHYHCATSFDYLSKANEICDWLNGDGEDVWQVMDMRLKRSKEAYYQYIKMFMAKKEQVVDDEQCENNI